MKNTKELREEAAVLRLWGTLVSVGIPLADAAKITADCINGVLKTALREAASRLDIGATLCEAVDGQGVFSGFIPYILGNESIHSGVSDEIRLMTGSRILGRKARMMRDGVPPNEIGCVMFYTLLGKLVEFGCPIRPALKISGSEYGINPEHNPLFEQVDNGEMIIDGMKMLPDKFNGQDLAYVSVAEQCGSLPEIFASLAEVIEKKAYGKTIQPRGHVQPIIFTAQQMMEYDLLATLMEAGCPVRRALIAIVKSIDGGTMHPFALMLKDIENGLVPSEHAQRQSYPAFIVEMFKLGEEQANFDVMLREIANFIKWDVLDIEPATVSQVVEA